MKKLKNVKPGREGIWQVIRYYKTFTVSDIKQYIPAHNTSIRAYLKQLEKGGYIRKIGVINKLGKIQFELIKDIGIHRPVLNEDGTPKGPGANQRMWMSMKVLKRFSYMDISLAAVVSKHSAKTYLKFLERANYIFIFKKSKASISPIIYQFKASNDTGYLAPQIRKDKSVYDQNTNKVVYRQEKRGAA